MRSFSRSIITLTLALVILPAYGESLPPERIAADRPQFSSETARPLRYRPDGTDFVIENGPEFFNRPLYGGSTAFRVDAGDKPECVLYLPGAAGNLRLGIQTPKGAKWLIDADKVVARYRPGSMVYEIEDALLGSGRISLTWIGLYDTEGLITQVEAENIGEDVRLIWAFGGGTGQKGRRGGDIGCESEPVSEFFRLKPDYCRDDKIRIHDLSFTLKGQRGRITGCLSSPTDMAVADANRWDSLAELLASRGKETQTPLLTGSASIEPGKSYYLYLEHVQTNVDTIEADLPAVFQSAEARRQSIANQLRVDTPDPYLNAAAAALCVAADAIWDEPSGSVMHGAVAWRSPYLGWRGPYANDVLGRHDRSRRHLTYWAKRQNDKPFEGVPTGADPEANYARSHPSKQTVGDIGGKHYDMNLVYIDALFRHILWTGDLDLARDLWPLIEKHMAWERRVFRRPFNDGRSPLYEAYAAIWASDDLQYGGGGVTHTTAYNYYHNLLAARIARLIGRDPAPYQQEADLLARAIRDQLWLPEQGWFAEYRDWLGLRRLHPSAGVWTFYHTLDSLVPNPQEAWQMSRFVDTQIARIPIHGPGVPDEGCFTVPTSNWMPYSWSVNNVVMAEAAHTALAYFQAGRPDTAYKLFKGCLLDSMYLGLCPGNAGMCTYFDMARGESQRDFGDGVGAVSRTLVEGLFGVTPNLLEDRLDLAPAFPADWPHASLNHPEIQFDYRRNGVSDRYTVEPKFSKPVALRMRLAARGSDVESLKINGRSAPWGPVMESVGRPRVRFESPAAQKYEIEITWKGETPAVPQLPAVVAEGRSLEVRFGDAKILEVADPQGVLKDVKTQGDRLEATVAGAPGHHTVFVSLGQCIQWWAPLDFEIRPPYAVLADDTQDGRRLTFRIRNNTPEELTGAAVIEYGSIQARQRIEAPAYGTSALIELDAAGLLPGATPLRVTLENGEAFEGAVTNWNLKAGPDANFNPVNLAAQHNDRVTRIFKNEYLSPRSPFTSLAIPKQGIGAWCNFSETHEIDDAGLRAKVRDNGGVFTLPQGIPFQTPGGENEYNILFVSQWDNYPNEATVPLEGKAARAYLLMAGSTNSMQVHIDNGEVVVAYADGSAETLALRSPGNWWPIDQDFYIDSYAFRRPGPIPPRVDLKTGRVRTLDAQSFKRQGKKIPGGAASVLDLPLNPNKELQSLTVRALSNEVVIGLMALTLAQE